MAEEMAEKEQIVAVLEQIVLWPDLADLLGDRKIFVAMSESGEEENGRRFFAKLFFTKNGFEVEPWFEGYESGSSFRRPFGRLERVDPKNAGALADRFNLTLDLVVRLHYEVIRVMTETVFGLAEATIHAVLEGVKYMISSLGKVPGSSKDGGQ